MSKNLNQFENVKIWKCENEITSSNNHQNDDADNADLNHLLPDELPNAWKELLVVFICT